MMINKKHKSLEGRKKILDIKKGMNSKRISYNWDHLKELYKY